MMNSQTRDILTRLDENTDSKKQYIFISKKIIVQIKISVDKQPIASNSH